MARPVRQSALKAFWNSKLVKNFGNLGGKKAHGVAQGLLLITATFNSLKIRPNHPSTKRSLLKPP
ncbi:MAG: hypothetical protein E4G98_05535 [Promethearchaeota archaeon]|nr:MAG: hypothetical protein E4G98_05535 [Candidatus Lokiarchaeota archaeon]